MEEPSGSSAPGEGSEAAGLFARFLEFHAHGKGEPGRAPQHFLREHPELARCLREFLEGLERHRTESGSAPARWISPLTGASSGESDLASTLLRRITARGSGLPRYASEEELAHGGQGKIVRVLDEELGRQLAMKVSHEPCTTTSPKGARRISRFLEEARLTAQLDHPGIVPVHELGLDDGGRVYFTMKLVKGRDLKEIFALVAKGQEGWTRTRALSVLLRVCEGMAYAHAKGVIHRDLKPGNVMVGRFGEVYVMDWGLARALGRTDTKDIRIQQALLTTEVHSLRHGSSDGGDALFTMDGDVVGTPAYMSPEQASGDLDAMGPHSDVYSAGAMLYHLWAGHPPYVQPGVRIHNYAIWLRVQEGPPAPVHEQAPEMPAELVAICEKAMARDPAHRYRDMSELAEDLRAFLEHRVVRAYETGAVAELRKWVARNQALAASIGATLLVALGALSIVGYVQSRSADRARRLEQAAETQRDNVMQLSAFQRLADLRRRADDLWPARPAMVPRYEEWLLDARRLVAGLDPDPEHRYAGHYATLATLRERALPDDDARRSAAIAAHPRRGEFAALRARTEALRHALEVRAGRADPPSPALPQELARKPAQELNRLAWSLVDPDGGVFGREGEGLAAASAALERARTDQQPDFGDTLAWALFATGQDEEALAASKTALAKAGPEGQDLFGYYLARLQAAITARAEHGEEWLATLERRSRTLEWSCSGLRFAEDEDGWWFAQLAGLIEEIEALRDPRDGVLGAGLSPHHGWGVEHRLAFARSVEEATRSGPRARALWDEAIASIADLDACPQYEGLQIGPQLGLLPCGRDPESGLWEFVDLQTGTVPARDTRGQLMFTEASGLVFVLLPGGEFLMGAQKQDRAAPGYDPEAEPMEGPPHWRKVEPLLFSKYEMNQAQWFRVVGVNPSFYKPASEQTVGSLLHPVEMVSHEECEAVLARLGLELPSEEQWEYAARAGTESPWWSGDTPATLAGRANVYDRSLAHSDPNSSPGDATALDDDGFAVHAPVNALAANPFGLHGIIGNVFEWCRDVFHRDAYERLARGETLAEEPRTEFVVRGGTFTLKASMARSACRQHYDATLRQHAIGVRPIRVLDRPGPARK